MNKMVLVTGGAGYIGSHTCVALLSSGWQVVVADNLCNSKIEAVRHVERITGGSIPFFQIDIRDTEALAALFTRHCIEAVIHFAALKAVHTSVENPLAYYANNIGGLLALCQVMAEFKVKTLVFSSSAAVYGHPDTLPITEDCPLAPCNPYGQTKRIGEQFLNELHQSDSSWRVACLRYFNPVGAHESGLIGEDPKGPPNNLMPVLAQVAAGRGETLTISGKDYPTPDGTGIRDYLHVVDMASAHVRALEVLMHQRGSFTVNLGTGRGYSVLELVRAFEAASGRQIPYLFGPRRPGDVAVCYADPSRAEQLLGWRAEYDLARMCADAWRWQSMNPDGYTAP